MRKDRFESVHNDIGFKDHLTGEEYVYFSSEVITLMNNIDKRRWILEDISEKQEELIETLQRENKQLSRKLLETEKEKQSICNTIKDSMQNERTHIGYNVLKQLAEGLEIL